jgi:hypothetical protein
LTGKKEKKIVPIQSGLRESSPPFYVCALDGRTGCFLFLFYLGPSFLARRPQAACPRVGRAASPRVRQRKRKRRGGLPSPGGQRPSPACAALPSHKGKGALRPFCRSTACALDDLAPGARLIWLQGQEPSGAIWALPLWAPRQIEGVRVGGVSAVCGSFFFLLLLRSAACALRPAPASAGRVVCPI